ncbi:MAG: class I SAM-dependent methyltransferase [Chloroflexota bacterium]
MMKKPVPAEHQLYQSYSTEEELDRIKGHYEQDPKFFYLLTGGTWNTYSCTLWEREDSTPTEAEEAKLDLFARGMDLKPGMRILDVGSGWGGPLVYLCKKYGVSGVGISVNADQTVEANARAERYGVDAKFYLKPWQEYEPELGSFDGIYSDEVITHFQHLDQFFACCYEWLRKGGRMVHKELHYTHMRHSIFGRMGEHVHGVYNYSGNYVILASELQMLNDTGFEIVDHIQMPITNYQRTMDYWLKNTFDHKEEMIELGGEPHWRDFRKYLKIIRRLFSTNAMSCDVVVSQKIDPDDHA